MPLNEEMELLNAALALAMIDGRLSRSEMGVIQGLANRIGVGQISLEAMVTRARSDPNMHQDLKVKSEKRARKILSLLVAQARIDGVISDAERELLVKLAVQLGIDTDQFGNLYAEGVAHADEILERRRQSQGDQA